jgi:hypothetical protein
MTGQANPRINPLLTFADRRGSTLDRTSKRAAYRNGRLTFVFSSPHASNVILHHCVLPVASHRSSASCLKPLVQGED